MVLGYCAYELENLRNVASIKTAFVIGFLSFIVIISKNNRETTFEFFTSTYRFDAFASVIGAIYIAALIIAAIRDVGINIFLDLKATAWSGGSACSWRDKSTGKTYESWLHLVAFIGVIGSILFGLGLLIFLITSSMLKFIFH